MRQNKIEITIGTLENYDIGLVNHVYNGSRTRKLEQDDDTNNCVQTPAAEYIFPLSTPHINAHIIKHRLTTLHTNSQTHTHTHTYTYTYTHTHTQT